RTEILRFAQDDTLAAPRCVCNVELRTMDAEPAIDAQDVTKQFGAAAALSGITLSVQRGELFGLVGPDGAGKSTFLRVLAGLLHLSGGRASIDGIDVQKDPSGAKRRIG